MLDPLDQVVVQNHIANTDDNRILVNCLKEIIYKVFKLLVRRTLLQNIAGDAAPDERALAPLFPGIFKLEFGERLKQEVQEIENSLPWGYVLEFATYQPELIKKAVSGMVVNVVESVAIVLVVVMLLLGLRTGLIVGSFIPLVMLFGLLTMYALGIDLERMSLATMIIALGMFVDNAIVVSDDIKVNMEKGLARKEAVLKTGSTLTVPLLTSTLTTVFAFGPILLQIGTTGDYTSSLGSVMIILLMGSWFFSMF